MKRLIVARPRCCGDGTVSGEGWYNLASRIAVIVAGICLAVSSIVYCYDLTHTDPAGDDYGPGTYLYPLDAVFTPGSFDMVSLRVREVGSKVRFEIGIAGEIQDPWGSGAGFSLQSVDIYIDEDGVPGSGATAALERRNVEFSATSAWEYVVWCAPPFDDFAAHVVDWQGNTYFSGIDVTVDQGNDIITIDVPKSILGTPDTDWRYVVLMLSQNGYEPGRVRPVVENVGQWVLGGGDNGQWDSNIIDLVAEPGVNQEVLLANYDPTHGTQPILINRVDADPPAISHTPPLSWEAHIPLEVEAIISDDVVTGASVFFRTPPATFQERVMARVAADLWSTLIQGSEIDADGLEYYIFATDATNSGTLPDSSSPFVVPVTPDVTPPLIEVLEAYPYAFSPNGDGFKDSTTVTVGLSEPGYVWVGIRDSLGNDVRSLADSTFAETGLEVAWDGRNQSGGLAADGTYRIFAACIDLGGHAAQSESTEVVLNMEQALRQLDVILLFHANQNLVPYGKAADRACYKGVLNTLRAHPNLKFVIHFSGSLLSDLLWEDPETIEILRQGAEDGQFEIAGSTYIQNIIYSTRSSPDDFQFNQHQIAIHKDLIEGVLGVSPVSFWNPERVWTQNIVKLLTDNAYEIVQIEDHILYDSGITGSEYAVRTTTYEGKSVYVFNDDKDFEGRVNGAIDSGDTTSVMWFLRGLYEEDQDDRYAVCYHEDMEATGLWDYENGEDPAVDFANLDKLLTAFENDPAIKVTTYSDFLNEHQPLEDVSPVVDGGAVWMGGSAWFAENAEPEAEAYREFFDSIRDTINAIHSSFSTYAPDTMAARVLIDHAWFTLVAHQYEFAVHGYQGIVGTTQWDLARTALVSARGAREALLGNERFGAEDINNDAVHEIVFVTGGDLFVFSPYGGRLLYWFDLEDGKELVGNENFMRSYGESYTDDNAYVPVAVGCEAYPWLCGNMIIPEIHAYTFEARRRCLNDWIWIDGEPAGSPVNTLLDYDLDSNRVEFTYDLGYLTVTKTVTPSLHSLGLEYLFSSASPQALNIELEMENGLSPDCLGVMMTGRGSLTYWDGEDTSSVFTGTMRGVVNPVSGKGVLFDFADAPTSASGEEDVFGLEMNPRWSFAVAPQGSLTLRATLSQEAFSGIEPPGRDDRQHRLLILPNPSAGGVNLSLGVESQVELAATIFDLSGRHIRTLYGRGTGPTLTISWDGNNHSGHPVANGIYFVRVSYGGREYVGKTVIVR